MKSKKYPNFLGSVFAVIYFWAAPLSAAAGISSPMQSLNDKEMREVSGQGLIVSDYIQGDDPNLAGTNAYSTPFDFYRIGLNGRLDLNLNISKLQLGCGGINDHLSGHAGCDIDIDYASLMGRDGTDIGAPGSAFKLTRPYMEFAVKNGESTTLREIAGIKIGAQTADGGLTAGRRYYQNGTNTNIENTAFASSCNTGDDIGSGVAGCHSGINSVSGFLGSELSLTMRVNACIGNSSTFLGCNIPLGIPLDAWGCTGRITQGHPGPCDANSEPLFVDIAGTRMETLGLRAAQLNLDGNGFSQAITAILDSAYAQLRTDLRTVHKLTFENTGDFFLSFQREPIAYPRYSKQSPVDDIAQGSYGTQYDLCRSEPGAARCNSAFSVPANTGWWLNAPSVKLLDVHNPNVNLGDLSLTDALTLIGDPGYLIENPEFNLTPGQNCYGSSTFC